MDSRELAEWQAYAQLDPFGNARGDLRAGIVASTFANAHRDQKKRKKPFTAQEFMPEFAQAKRQPQQTWQEQLAIVEMLNKALGGKDLRAK